MWTRYFALIIGIWFATAAAPVLGADESRVERAGCVVRMGEPGADGIAPVAAECRWAVSHQRVVAVILDQEHVVDVMTRVAHHEDLGDGRYLQVHSLGWGFADRQVTLAHSTRVLDDGGVRVEFRAAQRQAPLVDGRVQILSNDGFWEVRPDGNGTFLSYGLRYDPGGNLKPWLLRRFQTSGIALSLEDVRRAAER